MKRSIGTVILVIIGAALLNAGGQYLKETAFDGPYFLDSIFTIVAGIFFGWIPGLITGLITNLTMELFHGFPGTIWPFAIVNMSTGVLAGLIAADKNLYWTVQRQILMIGVLTISNTVLGALIVNIVYGGFSGSAPDVLVSALLLMGENKYFSTLLARIPMNLVDKGIPVLLIFIIYKLVIYRRSGKGKSPGGPAEDMDNSK